MPLLIPLAIVFVAIVVGIALTPIGLVQRYRSGSARRVARRWVATVNITMLSVSTVMFLGSAALTNIWIPNALNYSLGGFATGCLLGVAGLALTVWEPVMGKLHYTPNRFLVLLTTLVVLVRIIYGVWRLWNSFGEGGDARGWLLVSGVPGSFAAGAVVLGYTFAYWVGIRRQANRISGMERS